MIIAIDGPAASGKGTLAQRLAQHYGYHHLDTGLLYRAVALSLLRQGLAPDNREAAIVAAKALDLAGCDDSELKSPRMGEAASIVSAVPEVRAALLDYQRAFAARKPGAVLDGRDIGTVVCPAADVKLFITASADVRARRRTAELRAGGAAADEALVLADILRRDERDRTRTVSPLVVAADATVVDNSRLGIQETVAAAIAVVDAAFGRTESGRAGQARPSEN